MASNAGDSGAYPTLLNAELEGLRKAGDYYLRHEHLSEDNSSVYFHEFAARADSYSLQYLAEADLSSMISSNLSTEVATTLAKIAPDIIRMEQYMDFLRNRTFRQTLLTHRGVTLNRHLTGESLRPFTSQVSYIRPSKPLTAAASSKMPVAQRQGHEIRSWRLA